MDTFLNSYFVIDTYNLDIYASYLATFLVNIVLILSTHNIIYTKSCLSSKNKTKKSGNISMNGKFWEYYHFKRFLIL